uniref:Uncharacterized protein n=1 Tax=Anguilla anguilla TaxID=7936 RepID=A0A0E9TQR5_ANGAN
MEFLPGPYLINLLIIKISPVHLVTLCRSLRELNNLFFKTIVGPPLPKQHPPPGQEGHTGASSESHAIRKPLYSV